MHRFWTEIPSINMVHLITQIGNYIPFVKLNSMGSFVLSDENLVELVQNLDLTILVPNDLESLIYGKKYSIFDIYYNKITYNEQIFFTYVDILFTYMTYLVNLLFVIVAKMVQTALAWRWVHVWYGWYPKNSLLYLPNILASRILFPFAQRYQAKARRWQLGNIYLLFVGVYAEVLIKVYTMPLWCPLPILSKKNNELYYPTPQTRIPERFINSLEFFHPKKTSYEKKALFLRLFGSSNSGMVFLGEELPSLIQSYSDSESHWKDGKLLTKPINIGYKIKELPPAKKVRISYEPRLTAPILKWAPILRIRKEWPLIDKGLEKAQKYLTTLDHEREEQRILLLPKKDSKKLLRGDPRKRFFKNKKSRYARIYKDYKNEQEKKNFLYLYLHSPSDNSFL